MAQAGVEVLLHTSHLGSVGLIEPMSTVPGLIRSFFALRRAVNERKPDLAILVGHEIFNWLLAWYLAMRRVPRLCLFPPQIWLWGSVLRVIGPAYTAVLSSFPEEHRLYTQAGVPSYFVGHYLCDSLGQRDASAKLSARRALGQADEGPVVALLPGSRSLEIRQLTALLLGVARELNRVDGRIRFVLPVADPVYAQSLEEQVAEAGLARLVRLTNESGDAMRAADLAIMASGTASLEAALIGVPTVIVYRIAKTSMLAVRVARFLGLVSAEYVGLPNLICGHEVVPEYRQRRANVDVVAAKAMHMLSDVAARDAMLLQFARIRPALAGRDFARQEASELVLRLLESSRPQFQHAEP